MSEKFEQISIKPGFMKHNGGLLFKTISENEYEFKAIIKDTTIVTIKNMIIFFKMDVLQMIKKKIGAIKIIFIKFALSPINSAAINKHKISTSINIFFTIVVCN